MRTSRSKDGADTLTSYLAELVASTGLSDLSPAARQVVHDAFMDALGCILAGVDSDEARLVGVWALALGGRGDATLVGRRGQRAPAALAALVNATAGHALDLDDVSPAMTHPSVCLVPPLLATAERIGASGATVMSAYVGGFEVCVRLCRALNPPHYYRGWHSMGTANALGVAAAVARLLGLGPAGVSTAMAIAASSAAGMRKNFGTMVKPLHAGQTAYHGTQAAELAAAGFTADAAILDGQHGFLDVFGDAETTGAAITDDRLELETSGLIFKRYACCGALHPAIDAVLGLMATDGLKGGDIARITCAVNARAPHVLVHHHADTPAEGRFSVEYSLAVAAVDGDAGPAQYTYDRVADAAVQDLARRVEVVVDETLPTGYALFPAVVEIETTDGRTFRRRADLAHGDPSDPLTPKEIGHKFRSCAALVLGEAGADGALVAVEALPGAPDVTGLMAALTP
jgi:2-methylcitrate dehydratase PrpD